MYEVKDQTGKLWRFPKIYANQIDAVLALDKKGAGSPTNAEALVKELNTLKDKAYQKFNSQAGRMKTVKFDLA